jgi:hypothetical protein
MFASFMSYKISHLLSSHNDPRHIIHHNSRATRTSAAANMVCAKCQKLNKTTLATPGVKKKTEMYYGSPASSSSSEPKKSATLGQTGISKVGIQTLQCSII